MPTPPPDPNARYRVRDKDWKSHTGDHSKALHGEDLSLADANRLKERVVALQRVSTTARVEPMSVPPPAWWVLQFRPERAEAELAELSAPAMPEVPGPGEPPQSGPTIELADHLPREAPCNGVVRSIPPRSLLLVNNLPQPVPVSVVRGDILQAVSQEPAVAATRAAAAGAVSQVIQQRRVPTDVTVKPRAPRTQPAPPDKTLSNQPTVIRLGAPATAPAKPLPSPLKVAELPEGDPVLDGDLGETDVQDLAVDLGGGPTAADLEYARKQAEAERKG